MRNRQRMTMLRVPTLGDPFGRVQTLAILFAMGLARLIFSELRHPSPTVNFCSFL
jgi:hypothetical protein